MAEKGNCSNTGIKPKTALGSLNSMYMTVIAVHNESRFMIQTKSLGRCKRMRDGRFFWRIDGTQRCSKLRCLSYYLLFSQCYPHDDAAILSMWYFLWNHKRSGHQHIITHHQSDRYNNVLIDPTQILLLQ